LVLEYVTDIDHGYCFHVVDLVILGTDVDGVNFVCYFNFDQ